MFAEWYERTGDHKIAAERAGVSERTGRRWKSRVHPRAAEPLVVRGAPAALATPVTRFIGRQSALQALKKLFADGARLVSVLGPAGIGKTRLAARFAEGAVAAYAGGVAFVDLSTARTLEEVCAHVLGALGVEPSPRATDEEHAAQAGHALAGLGDALLVLDNFEQATPHAAASIGRWLALAPRARLLVTSRERLRVQGELSWYLDPLEAPAEVLVDRKTALASEAVQLFVDRARLVRPGYDLPEEDVADVVHLVKRLDGTPLAIELAAARMGVLAPKQLVERLERRFELLVGTTRDTSARQTSMRAALDWSWDLLPPLERAVFAQVAVFRGPFSLEAAEAVVDLSEVGPGATVLDALESLKQRSLLFTVIEDGRAVFNLYDGIRDYAHEKLDALGMRHAASLRHAEHFAIRFEGRTPSAETGASPRDLEDLLAGARYALKASPPLARRAVLAAAPWLQGRPAALRQLLDQALAGDASERARKAETPKPEAVDATLARLYAARADFRRMRGENERAAADIDRALALARALRDRRVEGHAVALRGLLEHGKGHFDEAERNYAEALAVAREIGDARLEAHALGSWALTERLRRHVDHALDLAEKALALHREHGDVRQATSMLTVVATLQQFRGQPERARRAYEDALDLARRTGDRAREAVVLGNLGTLKQEAGDLEGARTDLERAAELLHKLGLRRVEGMAVGNLGSVFFEMGRVADARDCYEKAISLVAAAGDVVHEALFNAHLGGALATQDDLAEAERRVERAEELLLPMMGEEELARAAALHRGHVELAQARRAELGGEPEKAERLREAVRGRVDGARALRSPGDDVRFTLRMLARALDRPSDPDSAAGRGSVTVTADASHVRTPRGETFSLEKRRSVRLVLRRLVDGRRETPAKPLTVDELLAAGWPGERVLREAGASRVYVALGTLRKLGLRDVIVSRDGGYFIDPRVDVLVVSRL